MAWGHNTGKADEGLYGGGRNDFYMNEEMASRSIPELSFDQKVDIFYDFMDSSANTRDAKRAGLEFLNKAINQEYKEGEYTEAWDRVLYGEQTNVDESFKRGSQTLEMSHLQKMADAEFRAQTKGRLDPTKHRGYHSQVFINPSEYINLVYPDKDAHSDDLYAFEKSPLGFVPSSKLFEEKGLGHPINPSMRDLMDFLQRDRLTKTDPLTGEQYIPYGPWADARGITPHIGSAKYGTDPSQPDAESGNVYVTPYGLAHDKDGGLGLIAHEAGHSTEMGTSYHFPVNTAFTDQLPELDNLMLHKMQGGHELIQRYEDAKYGTSKQIKEEGKNYLNRHWNGLFDMNKQTQAGLDWLDEQLAEVDVLKDRARSMYKDDKINTSEFVDKLSEFSADRAFLMQERERVLASAEYLSREMSAFNRLGLMHANQMELLNNPNNPKFDFSLLSNNPDHSMNEFMISKMPPNDL
tara:strand:+ start:31 stop:1425 length:1395 start_codon:yes stop_codon:yes gene_type:complete